MRRFLNVGGHRRSVPVPRIYDGWENVLLDIDPAARPDILCDARELTRLKRAEYDAVYCSHNLEHFYRHDVPRVLAGFLHVLKADGFAHIRVPDLGEVMRRSVQDGIDIDDALYTSPAGPITVGDVIYGYAREIEQSGNDFFAHKTGFTEKSLTATLQRCGFAYVFSATENLEVFAYAFREKPDAFARQLLDLPDF